MKKNILTVLVFTISILGSPLALAGQESHGKFIDEDVPPLQNGQSII